MTDKAQALLPVTPETDGGGYTTSERELLNSLGGYQKVFNAIADATSVYAEGVGVNIGVRAFIRSITPHRISHPLPGAWRSIDSAPTDGQTIFAICASAYTPTAFDTWWQDGWTHYSRPDEKWHGGVGKWFPTHWMPREVYLAALTPSPCPGDVGTRAAQIADLIVSPDTAANDIQRQAYWHVAHEAAKLALGVPEDDPACTDCGDTGVTYQTESPCSCLAALTPSALSGDAGEALAWLSEHTNCELSHRHDFCEDDPEWQVHVVNGGKNDREWTLVGSGETIVEAIFAARAALPSHQGAGEP